MEQRSCPRGTRSAITYLLAAAALACTQAQAVPVTLTFSGTLTQFLDRDLQRTEFLGTPFSGTVTYDPANADPAFGSYISNPTGSFERTSASYSGCYATFGPERACPTPLPSPHDLVSAMSITTAFNTVLLSGRSGADMAVIGELRLRRDAAAGDGFIVQRAQDDTFVVEAPDGRRLEERSYRSLRLEADGPYGLFLAGDDPAILPNFDSPYSGYMVFESVDTSTFCDPRSGCTSVRSGSMLLGSFQFDSLTPVPEPSVVALMLAGLVVLGTVTGRRRRLPA